MMDKFVVATILSAATLAGGGWGAHEYLWSNFASSDAVKVAGAKADFVIDRQMAALYSELGFLERKPVKTPADIDRMRYLREQLEEMKRVKAGK